MIGNVIRLAELLQKEQITGAEKREAINLTQSMFGTTALAHRDHTLVALRRKKSIGANDPANLIGRHTVIGVNTNNGSDVVTADEAEQLDKLSAGEFILGDDVYGQKEDSAGRPYFTKNGKRISRAEFEAAQLEADGDVEES